MPSSKGHGTAMLIIGLLMLAVAGASYWRILTPYDIPLQEATGAAHPYFMMMLAFLGLAFVAGSFFWKNE